MGYFDANHSFVLANRIEGYVIRKHEKGLVFIPLLMILFVGSLLVPAFLNRLDTRLISSPRTLAEPIDYYSAESGAEDAVWRLLYEEGFADHDDYCKDDDYDWSTQYTITVNGKEVPVTITQVQVIHAIVPVVDLAIFAAQEGSAPDNVLDWTGSGAIVTGNIHSNSDIRISGSNNQITGLAEANLGFNISGSGNTFGSQDAAAPICHIPVNLFPPQDFFAPYTFSFTGNVDLKTIDEVWLDPPTKTMLKPGVYFTTGTLTLSGSGVTGNVTLIGDEVKISGSDTTLTAFSNGVVLYGTGTSNQAVKVSGSDETFTGIIYAPNGGIDISGSNEAVAGGVVGQRVKLSGSSSTIAFGPTPDLEPQGDRYDILAASAGTTIRASIETSDGRADILSWIVE